MALTLKEFKKAFRSLIYSKNEPELQTNLNIIIKELKLKPKLVKYLIYKKHKQKDNKRKFSLS